MVTGPFVNLPSQKTLIHNAIEAIGELERLVKMEKYVKYSHTHAAKNVLASGRRAGTVANGS